MVVFRRVSLLSIIKVLSLLPFCRTEINVQGLGGQLSRGGEIIDVEYEFILHIICLFSHSLKFHTCLRTEVVKQHAGKAVTWKSQLNTSSWFPRNNCATGREQTLRLLCPAICRAKSHTTQHVFPRLTICFHTKKGFRRTPSPDNACYNSIEEVCIR